MADVLLVLTIVFGVSQTVFAGLFIYERFVRRASPQKAPEEIIQLSVPGTDEAPSPVSSQASLSTTRLVVKAEHDPLPGRAERDDRPAYVLVSEFACQTIRQCSDSCTQFNWQPWSEEGGTQCELLLERSRPQTFDCAAQSDHDAVAPILSSIGVNSDPMVTNDRHGQTDVVFTADVGFQVEVCQPALINASTEPSPLVDIVLEHQSTQTILQAAEQCDAGVSVVPFCVDVSVDISPQPPSVSHVAVQRDSPPTADVDIQQDLDGPEVTSVAVTTVYTGIDRETQVVVSDDADAVGQSDPPSFSQGSVVLAAFLDDIRKQQLWKQNPGSFELIWAECNKLLESLPSAAYHAERTILHAILQDMLCDPSLIHFTPPCMLEVCRRLIESTPDASWVVQIVSPERRPIVSAVLDSRSDDVAFLAFANSHPQLSAYMSDNFRMKCIAVQQSDVVGSFRKIILDDCQQCPTVFSSAQLHSPETWLQVIDDDYRTVSKALMSYACSDSCGDDFLLRAVLPYAGTLGADLCDLFSVLSTRPTLSSRVLLATWSVLKDVLADEPLNEFHRRKVVSFVKILWSSVLPSGSVLSLLPTAVVDGSADAVSVPELATFCLSFLCMPSLMVPLVACDHEGRIVSSLTDNEGAFLSKLCSDRPRDAFTAFLRLRLFSITGDTDHLSSIPFASLKELRTEQLATFWLITHSRLFSADSSALLVEDTKTLALIVVNAPIGKNSPFSRNDWVSVLEKPLRIIQDQVTAFYGANPCPLCSSFMSSSQSLSSALELLQAAHGRKIVDASVFAVFSETAVSDSLKQSKDDKNNLHLWLMRRYPFLYSLEAKLLVFADVSQPTFLSSDVDRIGGLDRNSIFDSSYHTLYEGRKRADWKKRWKVSFSGDSEHTIDIDGVKREFFTLISEAIARSGLFVDGSPNPNLVRSESLDAKFCFVGRLLAKSLLERNLLNLHFQRFVYKKLLGAAFDLEEDFPDVAEKVRMVMSLPSVDGILFEDGLSDSTRHQWCQHLQQQTLSDPLREWSFAALARGFCDVIPLSAIRMFSATDLELALCGTSTFIAAELRKVTVYTQGYSDSSPEIVILWACLDRLSDVQRQAFLQFVTGSKRVPPGGVSSFVPPFTVQRVKDTQDGKKLPSASTCFHLLKWPMYQSLENAWDKLLLAITEGSEGFSFS